MVQPLPPSLTSLPLPLISAILSTGVSIPSLSTDLPLLTSLLLDLSNHLSPTITSPTAATTLYAAREALSAAVTSHVRATLPITLLRSSAAPPPVRASVIASCASMRLAHAARIPAGVVAGVSVGADEDAWEEASVFVATAASEMLEELAEFWASARGVDDEVVASGLVAVLRRAVIEARERRFREDGRIVRKVLVALARSRAEIDAVRSVVGRAEVEAGAAVEKDGDEGRVLIAKADATASKVRLVSAKAMRDTYCGAGVVDVLKKAKGVVGSRKEELEALLKEKERKLQEYQELGENFADIAKKYRETLKEREGKTWSLSQLGAGERQDGVEGEKDDVGFLETPSDRSGGRHGVRQALGSTTSSGSCRTWDTGGSGK